MAMNQPLVVERLREALRPFFARHGIRKAVVFGSYARNTQDRKSDLDLLLVQDTEKRFFDRYDDIADIHDCLEGIQADILIYTPEELERISSRPFIRRALEEGIVIHGD